jgi:hypothetical protein
MKTSVTIPVLAAALALAVSGCGPNQSSLTPAGAANWPTTPGGSLPTNWNNVNPAILNAMSGVYTGVVYLNDPIVGQLTQSFSMTVSKLSEPVQNTTATYLYARFVSNGAIGDLGFEGRLGYAYDNGTGHITAYGPPQEQEDLTLYGNVYVLLSVQLSNSGQVMPAYSTIQYRECLPNLGSTSCTSHGTNPGGSRDGDYGFVGDSFAKQ